MRVFKNIKENLFWDLVVMIIFGLAIETAVIAGVCDDLLNGYGSKKSEGIVQKSVPTLSNAVARRIRKAKQYSVLVKEIASLGFVKEADDRGQFLVWKRNNFMKIVLPSRGLGNSLEYKVINQAIETVRLGLQWEAVKGKLERTKFIFIDPTLVKEYLGGIQTFAEIYDLLIAMGWTYVETHPASPAQGEGKLGTLYLKDQSRNRQLASIHFDHSYIRHNTPEDPKAKTDLKLSPEIAKSIARIVDDQRGSYQLP